MNRRYDIDWLRIITIGLLLIYHIAIVFQPWGALIGFLQNGESLQNLWIPMTMLNVWRIPLLFFVSGVGVGFALRKRNLRQLLLERTKRIFLPFLFGLFAIVPLHLFVWQKYYNQDLSYLPNPGHLWFLGFIFIYALILSPVFFYLKKNEKGKFVSFLRQLFSHFLGMFAIIALFVLEALLVNPEIFELYAMTLHGFLLGFLAFFFGFCFVLCGSSIWNSILKRRWLYLFMALILYIFRLLVFEMKSPNYLMAIESNVWIFAVLGFGYKYLNRPGKTLSYLSQAAYPIYILHMIILYLASFLILPMDISITVKLFIIILLTFAGCFTLYEFVIRKITFIRPLFGLKKAGNSM